MMDFHPRIPEKMIKIEVSLREASLITELRKYHFGRCTVHKLDGVIVRLETNESKLINEDGGLSLAIK